jgi:hypothetical protein
MVAKSPATNGMFGERNETPRRHATIAVVAFRSRQPALGFRPGQFWIAVPGEVGSVVPDEQAPATTEAGTQVLHCVAITCILPSIV